MGYQLACRDVGENCSYVARGETMDDMQADLAKHLKTVHSYTDACLIGIAMMDGVKAAVKKE